MIIFTVVNNENASILSVKLNNLWKCSFWHKSETFKPQTMLNIVISIDNATGMSVFLIARNINGFLQAQ